MAKTKSKIRLGKSWLFQKAGCLSLKTQPVLIELIGGPYKRDLLIEYLHKIQDAENCLMAGHMHALASLMKLPMAEVYEVASFYDHFDIVKHEEDRPAPITIRVCDSLSCMMAGAETLISELEAGADKSKIRIMRAPCMGGCDVAPAARIGDAEIGNATVDDLLALGRKGKNQQRHSGQQAGLYQPSLPISSRVAMILPCAFAPEPSALMPCWNC